MAMDTESQETSGRVKNMKKRIENLGEKMKRLPGLTWKTVWKVGRDDPRRVIHSLKVGLSLTLVSLLYLMEPLFKGVGENAIWAVMTVVVVLEFTAGATLCKGLNRGIGTLLAGLLALLIEYVAEKSGRVFRAIFIGAAVFLIGSASTYTRFIPYIKKNYDYGVMIFLLTFNLITVSSYRVENVLKMAQERFYTIAIGCSICLFMAVFVFPKWSGEDLHNSTVSKLEGLAKSIQACVNEYFSDEEETEESREKSSSSSEDLIYKGYKAVLESKSNDETLAMHASWEPRHSRHCRYPWQQYVKLGSALRHFGYSIVALHGCLQTEIQTPRTVRALFKDPCIRLAAEVSKALLELSQSISNRRQWSPEILSDHLHQALQDLNTALKSQPRLFLGRTTTTSSTMLALAAATASQKYDKDFGVSLSSVKTNTSALLSRTSEKEMKVLRPTLSRSAITTSLEFSEALPFAAFASLLVEVVARLELVIEEVEELGRVACFKEFKHDDEVVVVTRERPKMENLASHGLD
ncbi:hypothetical protein HYC85_001325 [Camellia sinensis]|uniref:Aluminum-activated malate transporter 12 n=1 Tax=Camellia sinensis TaxID=4442 RepID=A0A7J7I6J3_CAMSI|nr:hypothetical protein HYC85_001325 [Camellia sinensis]